MIYIDDFQLAPRHVMESQKFDTQRLFHRGGEILPPYVSVGASVNYTRNPYPGQLQEINVPTRAGVPMLITSVFLATPGSGGAFKDTYKFDVYINDSFYETVSMFYPNRTTTFFIDEFQNLSTLPDLGVIYDYATYDRNTFGYYVKNPGVKVITGYSTTYKSTKVATSWQNELNKTTALNYYGETVINTQPVDFPVIDWSNTTSETSTTIATGTRITEPIFGPITVDLTSGGVRTRFRGSCTKYYSPYTSNMQSGNKSHGSIKTFYNPTYDGTVNVKVVNTNTDVTNHALVVRQ